MKEVLLATIPATTPTLAVLVGILLNQTGLIRLENRLDARINTLTNEIVALRKQLHHDIVMLIVETATNPSVWRASKNAAKG